jgi:hypothetical protein
MHRSNAGQSPEAARKVCAGRIIGISSPILHLNRKKCRQLVFVGNSLNKSGGMRKLGWFLAAF